jgi:pimeloyl-ACP methyl ester carboxylesterase
MRVKLMIIVTGCLLCLSRAGGAGAPPSEYVVLLHGLARTERSMKALEARLSAEGYGVINVGYPSRSATAEALAEKVVPEAVAECLRNGAGKIHFVTHSMGGILVRYYLSSHTLPRLGRVVMLAPPNSGSEAVDTLRDNFVFKWMNGPAGRQLGTGSDSLTKQLGPVNFELGVIAGDRSVNLILSRLIPGPDDGKVSVTATEVNGMKDHIVIHATHPFIMKNRQVIDQTVFFLKEGEFKTDKTQGTGGSQLQ